jgi:squalene synthase HpnC
MPREARPHIAAIYAFARIADDFADEGTREPAERLALLDAWQERLDAAASGRVTETGHVQHDAVFVALAETLRTFRPGSDECRALLSDLLSAFRQDVTTTRYETWSDLLDYCRRSANPVGRLVLRVTRQARPSADGKSDAVCTALQLTNFWQDLQVDWSRGRLYVPLEIVRRHKAALADLDRRELSAPWRNVMRDVGQLTRALFLDGRGVADDVRGRLRWELRATWLGGMRILDRLVEADYDVFHARPTLTRRDAPGILLDALTWHKDSAEGVKRPSASRDDP